MKASDISLGSEYEVQIGYFDSRARAVVLSRHAPGLWDCQIVRDSLTGSGAPDGALRIVPSRKVVRPWAEASEDYATQAAVSRAWDKATKGANQEVEELLGLLAPHVQLGSEFIDISTDSSGLPGEVTVTVDISLPELRRLAGALGPDGSPPVPSASSLSELIST